MSWKVSHDKTTNGWYLPAGGVTLSLGVGMPCFITVISYLVILKKIACSNSNSNSNSKEVKIVTGVLIFCYMVCILPIYIIEWIPFNEEQSPQLTLIIYTWYWLIYIVNVFVYIIYSPTCREAIRLFFKDIKNILNLKKQKSLHEDREMSSYQDTKKMRVYSLE